MEPEEKYTEEDVKDACESIRKQDMSIQDACIIFGLPRTIIQDRLKGKNSSGLVTAARTSHSYAYSRKQLEDAIQGVMEFNMSIRESCLKFGVPRSTLRGHLKRAQLGQQPTFTQGKVTKAEKKYTSQTMVAALKDIKEKNISIRETCRKYGLPRATVQGRLRREILNPKSILTPNEETDLVKWLIDIMSTGFPLKKENLLNSVQEIIIETERQTPFKDGRPGPTWYKNFKRRHLEISLIEKETQSKAKQRLTEEQIRKWFEKLESYLHENYCKDILTDPKRILVIDEIKFFSDEKDIYPGTVNDQELRKYITVLTMFNAYGNILDPMVVFPYIDPPDKIADSVPSGWFLGKSESGLSNGEIYYDYLVNAVHTWMIQNSIPTPVLVLIDGNKAQLTFDLCEFCIKEEIILYALPSEEILQPSETSIFKPFKSEWDKTLTNWKSESGTLTESDFCSFIKNIIGDNELCESIKESFRICGLYPFNSDIIDYSKCPTKLETLPMESESITTEVAFKEGMYDEFESDCEMPQEKVSCPDISKNDFTTAQSVLIKLQPTLEQKGINVAQILAEMKLLKIELYSPDELIDDESSGI